VKSGAKMKDNPVIKARFLQHVQKELDAGSRHNKKSIERIAASYGITDKTKTKEYTELAIVLKARSIAISPLRSKKSTGRSLTFIKAR
jgi:hypothetical protein